MANIQLDQIVRQSGNRTDGFINIAQKADYTWFQIPVILLEGSRPGPTLLLEACTHGDEQEGTEAILHLVKELESGDFAGTIVGVPALNTEAFSQYSRSSITDGANLNRSFPGNKTSYITNRLAAEYLERIGKNVDFGVSFHGGGQVLHLEPIVSYRPGTPVEEVSLGMAKAYNVKYVWNNSRVPFSGTASSAFNALGVPTITAECGSQCGRLYDREKNIMIHVNGVKNVMAHLGMLPEVPYEKVEQIIVELFYLHSKNGGIHKIAKQPNESVKEGEVLTYIEDLFGNVIEEIRAPFDGIVNGFWSVPVIRPGDWSSLYMKIF